jgi:hypothetical protein
MFGKDLRRSPRWCVCAITGPLQPQAHRWRSQTRLQSALLIDAADAVRKAAARQCARHQRLDKVEDRRQA